MELTFNELVEAVNGKLIVENSNKDFNSICTDTRKIEKNNVFLALKGDNFNGNKYVKTAMEKGASIAIVDEVCFDENEVKGNVIKVDNTYDALLNLAKYYREKLNVKVVGITGSTGKTSTKDLVAAFLQGKYKVFKTKGNFNNHIGLPLMILSMDSSIDVAVLEMGMSNLGEIDTLANCARPDIAMITNIGLSHIENLKTQENILKAKMEITNYFTDKNVLIVNGEDEFLKGIKETSFKVIKTGYDDNNMIRAYDPVLKEDSTSFKIKDNGKEYTFVLPMVGAHNILNSLLGIAASKELGVTYEEMIEGLKKIEATSMRLEFKETNGYTVINDCYNASPDSMKAALDVLKARRGKRKIAILGTMRELGDESKKAHKLVGEYAKNKADILITCGEFIEDYKLGYGDQNIFTYETKQELIQNLSNIISEGDVILVKASRGAKFEEIVEELVK
ncbi:UDP-N-acetylmuramoyl-tripeptide--D-alanyl-D-alanine ligase [Clostridium sp. DSM 8431]|uniref:UDP-N-acetylmuramoyl-tripeptide--D-alanyl-D- alanine ligase n=1 Tax=Clostridium sp. DSM 8431 TaxID=1761781 RepID=UPI0008F13283|nr:UDP-N-acetylmuramoyl-tripeptide--D-alanyl-D-alanine ligase [Clostridium sp. DSM 8431]SFU28413.1 UDP-N-acetylmuramoyl-tripeptide--D-alanyl-D-alanine ligase [Clostridium sp. DSM 8431]